MSSSSVTILETSLSLISISLESYEYFTNGIFKLVLQTWKDELVKQELKDSPRLDAITNKRASRIEDNWRISIPSSQYESPSFESISEKCSHLEEFVNISFTPVECSIICATELVKMIFGKPLNLLANQRGVSVLKEQYIAMQVDGDGQQDVGSRVLGLSAPLSAANIPIFFIATYFSDYVLVPVSAKSKVMSTLEGQNFIFSDLARSYVVAEDSAATVEPDIKSPISSPLLAHQDFQSFEEDPVKLQIDHDSKLLLTGAREAALEGPSGSSFYNSIIKTLLSPPRYFSLTIQSGSEISFLADAETSRSFPPNTLLGSPTDYVIPICLDLRDFPEDAKGIVSGVAGKLLDNDEQSEVHMSYLSTAKSSVVLVRDDHLEIVGKALQKPRFI